jgi:cytochrome c556
MKCFALMGAAVFTFWAAAAVAQGSSPTLQPNDIIAVRQSLMDLQGGVVAAMKAAVEGGDNVKPLTAGAKGLLSSSHVIPTLFPAGTDAGHNTKAKPAIWSDRAGFEKAAADLTAEAQKLVQLADANDKAGFATQFQAVGKACGACHRPYRAQ